MKLFNLKLFNDNVFLKKAVNVFFSNWLVFFIDFFTGVLIVNFYGSIGKGQFSGLIAFVGVLAAAFSLGLNNSKVYFENKKILSKDTSFTIQIYYQLLLTVFLFPVFLFFKNELASFLEIDINYLSILFCFIVLYVNTQIISLFFNTGFLGSGQVNKFRKLKFFISSIKLMSILLCVYFNLDIVYSIISITFLEIVLTLYLIFDQKLSLVERASINIHQLKEFIVFGIKANLTVVINNVMRRFDYFIITSFLGVSVLGKYSVALIFFTLVLSISQAINGLLFGELTRKEKPKKQIFNLLWLIFFISSFIGIVLMFLVKPFLSIFYGIEFVDAAPVARILIIAGVIQGSSGVFKVSLISKNKSQLNNLEQLITGTVQIFLMYIIIERFNLVGIAYSILVGSIVSFSLRYFFYEKN